MTGVDGVPETVAECDAQIEQERRLLATLLSPDSRIPVWDRIDTLLDRRASLTGAPGASQGAVTERASTIPDIGQAT